MTNSVAILGYDGVEALDLFGPLETFARTKAVTGGEGYEVKIVSPTGEPFTTESGVVIHPHVRFGDDWQIGTLVVPGGVGLRKREVLEPIVFWLKEQVDKIDRVASVCTGIYGLAASGVLDGRRVTTHWSFADDVAARYPRLNVEADAIFIRDGKFYTSAGVLAGVDLSLSFVQEDYGPGVALQVAREMVVYLKRPGGQTQFSEPLRFQARSSDRFADLAGWINNHLADRLDVDTLAAQCSLSPRQFTRRFQESFKTSPALYVQRIRLDMARMLLTSESITIDRIAETVGFRSEDSFRRAFERRFGVGPALYRASFSAAGGHSTQVA